MKRPKQWPKEASIEDKLLFGVKLNAGGCWEFGGSLFDSGYGQIRFNGKKQKAHRVAWQVWRGNIPDRMCICHICDNPKCINPAHLFLGTHLDNAEDKVNKGRSTKGMLVGENNPGAKLTAQEVATIKRRVLAGERQDALAKEFAVSQGEISNIKCGVVWAEVVSA